MITKKDLMYKFNTQNVDQIASMQLFIVNNNLLVSYKTIVGVLGVDDCWYITNTKYSPTTTRQINSFKKQNCHELVDQDDMEYYQDFYYPNGI